LRYLGDKSEAEELVQSLLVNIWIHRKSLDVTMSIKNYIYRSAVNFIYNYLKKKAVRAKYVEAEIEKGELQVNQSYDQIFFHDLKRSVYSIVETTFIEGKVEISQIGDNSENTMLKLTPNQKAIYIKKADRLSLEKIKEIEPFAVKPIKVYGDKLLVSPKVNVDQETSWTKNKMILMVSNKEQIENYSKHLKKNKN
jgi:RNA polymerase sigma factor (sigma-70 family)